MATWEAFCRYAVNSMRIPSNFTNYDSTMVTGLSSGGPVSLVYGFICMLSISYTVEDNAYVII